MAATVANPGSLAFYRDLDEIAAFDAHEANLVKADDAVQAALAPHLIV